MMGWNNFVQRAEFEKRLLSLASVSEGKKEDEGTAAIGQTVDQTGSVALPGAECLATGAGDEDQQAIGREETLKTGYGGRCFVDMSDAREELLSKSGVAVYYLPIGFVRTAVGFVETDKGKMAVGASLLNYYASKQTNDTPADVAKSRLALPTDGSEKIAAHDVGHVVTRVYSSSGSKDRYMIYKKVPEREVRQSLLEGGQAFVERATVDVYELYERMLEEYREMHNLEMEDDKREEVYDKYDDPEDSDGVESPETDVSEEDLSLVEEEDSAEFEMAAEDEDANEPEEMQMPSMSAMDIRIAMGDTMAIIERELGDFSTPSASYDREGGDADESSATSDRELEEDEMGVLASSSAAIQAEERDEQSEEQEDATADEAGNDSTEFDDFECGSDIGPNDGGFAEFDKREEERLGGVEGGLETPEMESGESISVDDGEMPQAGQSDGDQRREEEGEGPGKGKEKEGKEGKERVGERSESREEEGEEQQEEKDEESLRGESKIASGLTKEEQSSVSSALRESDCVYYQDMGCLFEQVDEQSESRVLMKTPHDIDTIPREQLIGYAQSQFGDVQALTGECTKSPIRDKRLESYSVESADYAIIRVYEESVGMSHYRVMKKVPECDVRAFLRTCMPGQLAVFNDDMKELSHRMAREDRIQYYTDCYPGTSWEQAEATLYVADALKSLGEKSELELDVCPLAEYKVNSEKGTSLRAGLVVDSHETRITLWVSTDGSSSGRVIDITYSDERLDRAEAIRLVAGFNESLDREACWVKSDEAIIHLSNLAVGISLEDWIGPWREREAVAAEFEAMEIDGARTGWYLSYLTSNLTRLYPSYNKKEDCIEVSSEKPRGQAELTFKYKHDKTLKQNLDEVGRELLTRPEYKTIPSQPEGEVQLLNGKRDGAGRTYYVEIVTLTAEDEGNQLLSEMLSRQDTEGVFELAMQLDPSYELDLSAISLSLLTEEEQEDCRIKVEDEYHVIVYMSSLGDFKIFRKIREEALLAMIDSRKLIGNESSVVRDLARSHIPELLEREYGSNKPLLGIFLGKEYHFCFMPESDELEAGEIVADQWETHLRLAYDYGLSMQENIISLADAMKSRCLGQPVQRRVGDLSEVYYEFINLLTDDELGLSPGNLDAAIVSGETGLLLPAAQAVDVSHEIDLEHVYSSPMHYNGGSILVEDEHYAIVGARIGRIVNKCYVFRKVTSQEVALQIQKQGLPIHPTFAVCRLAEKQWKERLMEQGGGILMTQGRPYGEEICVSLNNQTECIDVGSIQPVGMLVTRRFIPDSEAPMTDSLRAVYWEIAGMGQDRPNAFGQNNTQDGTAAHRIWYTTLALYQTEGEITRFERLMKAGHIKPLMKIINGLSPVQQGIDLEQTYCRATHKSGDYAWVEDKDRVAVYNKSQGGTVEILRKVSQQEVEQAIAVRGLTSSATADVRHLACDLTVGALSKNAGNSGKVVLPGGVKMEYVYNPFNDSLDFGQRSSAGNLSHVKSFSFDHGVSVLTNLESAVREIVGSCEF